MGHKKNKNNKQKNKKVNPKNDNNPIKRRDKKKNREQLVKNK